MRNDIIIEQLARAFKAKSSPVLVLAGQRITIVSVQELAFPLDAIESIQKVLQPLHDVNIPAVPGRSVQLGKSSNCIDFLGYAKFNDDIEDVGVSMRIDPSAIKAIYFEANLS